jgi:peptide/nickel transport system substrate-binding protein
VIPDEATRLAALQRGEIDIAYSIRGELADELTRTPGLTIKPALGSAPFWLYFPDQWDAQSPWHDRRVRLAASLALDLKTINQALTLGYSHLTGSIFPENFDFYWQPPAPVYDPAKAKALLAAAGFAKGFDAGNYFCDSSYANIAEGVVDNLLAVGIRCSLRPVERAAFIKEYSEKKYKDIIQAGPGAFGNAATRIEAHLVKGGVFSYGSYPDIDALYQQQAEELDRARREAILFKIQQLTIDRAMYAPVMDLRALMGIGPRVTKHTITDVWMSPFPSYEDMEIKD